MICRARLGFLFAFGSFGIERNGMEAKGPSDTYLCMAFLLLFSRSGQRVGEKGSTFQMGISEKYLIYFPLCLSPSPTPVILELILIGAWDFLSHDRGECVGKAELSRRRKHLLLKQCSAVLCSIFLTVFRTIHAFP